MFISVRGTNIGQFNDLNSYDEVVFCPDNDIWFTTMREVKIHA